MLFSYIPLLFSLPSSTAATVFTAQAFAACRSISSAGVYTQTYPALLSADFADAKTHYWSAAHGDLTPACAVFPTTANQVSQIVTILKEAKGVKFAVKSGGHDPNVGHGSVDGGVLISMKRMASTTLSKDKPTAVVGPGARWGEVVKALDPFGVTVVGGRLADVGVGGLLLGGGLSFLSPQYGLACDNVASYEVVLASGQIVVANSTANSDLFWALKGGGSQFGIATKFTLKTHPIGRVWGGVRIYPSGSAASLVNAVHDFTENYPDTKAAIIVTGEVSALSVLNILDFFVVFLFYDGPNPPPGVFEKFNAILASKDGTKTQTYTELLTATDAFNFYGLRFLIRGISLPNLPSPAGKDLLNYHYNTWKTYVAGKNLLNLRIGFIFSIAYQPLPALIARKSIEQGGPNPLGFKPDLGDHMWMEYDVAWLDSSGDRLSHAMAMNITTSINDYTRKTYGGQKNSNAVEGAEGFEPGLEYGPLFLNDAMFDQDPLRSYGIVNYERLKRVQKEVDPDGLFPSRTGGFGFS